MAKMNIVITAPVESFTKYAEDLGYSESVVTGYAEDGTPVVAPNPQSKQDYLAEKVKGIVSTALALPAVQAIRTTKQEEARNEEITTRTAIENATAITFTA